MQPLRIVSQIQITCTFFRPYKLVSQCSTGNWYLLDKWGYRLSKSVPSNHLVRFYKNKKYKTKNGKVIGLEAEPCDGEVSQSLLSDANIDVNMEPSDVPDSCSRTTEYVVNSGPKTSTPIKSKQILIVTGDEMPVSSDESATIDITNTSEKVLNNPWGNMDVNDISIEIVLDLNDTSDVKSVVLERVDKAPTTYFNPLTDANHKIAVLKFSLAIDPFKQHYVRFTGQGNICPSPPEISVPSVGDGSCLFNSISMLLTGRDTYSAILRHVVCNYISNPIKYPNLSLYLPSNYKSGKEYVVVSNMCSYKTWGTEVKIIAMAQITRFDILVYTVQGEWVHYKSSTMDNDHTERCFYISNKSGYHFDPVFDC